MSTYPRVKDVVFADGTDHTDAINAAADYYGVPPRLLTAGAIMESNLGENRVRLGQWPDVSFGDWQQTVQYAPWGDHSATGDNIAAVRAKFLDDWAYSLDVAAQQYGAYWEQCHDPLETFSHYNGGPGMAYADNPNAQHIRDSWEAAAQYVVTDEEADMVFDPNTAPERQVQSWTCSVRTATWMLESIGCDLNASEVQSILVPTYVTPELGLLCGDGSGLAAVLADQSGEPTGHLWPDWDWLQTHAGTMPIGLGSGTMYHWVAVRDVNDDGSLALMNPAPGYLGLGDTMTYDQYRYWSPWAAVYIDVAGEEDAVADAALQQQYDVLQAQYDSLNNYCSALTTTILPPALGTMEDAAASESSRDDLANVVTGQCTAIRQASGI